MDLMTLLGLIVGIGAIILGDSMEGDPLFRAGHVIEGLLLWSIIGNNREQLH